MKKENLETTLRKKIKELSKLTGESESTALFKALQKRGLFFKKERVHTKN